MKHALIDIRDNTIVQVVPQGGTFPVAQDYIWTDCPDAVVAYVWTYDGSTFAAPPPPPEPTPEQIQAELTNAVQRHLDSTAKTRGYDGILSLASYAPSTVPKFAAEGSAGVAWRDAVWAYCWGVLADVGNGLRQIPTAAELVAELPTMAWPE